MALPVQHFGGGSLQLLQDLQQLSVVVAEASPTQNTSQVVTCAQRQHTELALHRQTIQSVTFNSTKYDNDIYDDDNESI